MKTKQQSKKKDAISLLEKDHDTVRKLLSELEETTSRGVRKRGELLEKIALEVEVHAAIEEEIFYPAFRRRAKTKEDEKLYLEAAEEHELVHRNLPELKNTDPATERFSARAKVLKDLIEHHAEEEENELLPRARELMSREEPEELGAKLEERKLALMERKEGKSPSAALPARNGRRTVRN
jgi:hemerythrin-like domain-containing protein